MLEIEDEYSQNWAELTESFYAENEENYAETAVAYPDERDQVEVHHHEKPEFSRRFQGASTSEFENEYPSLTEGALSKQRERDFDVRNRLNRSRRGDYHGDNGPWRRDRRRGGYSDNVPWKRDHSRESYDDSSPYSLRPRNTHRSNETSPFRSPLNRAKRSGFGDLDNSNTFRFTSQRRGDDRSDRVKDNTRYFSKDNIRSCRRLYLPSQNEDDYCEDETNKRFQVVTEEDQIKLARREKDIAYGKNTDDYKTYLQAVLKHRRKRDRKVHPRTPDKYVNCSRRSWDAQVKKWKLGLHAWAAKYQDASSRGDCSQKSSCSEGTTLTSECTSEKEEDNKLVLADDSFELSEGEDEKEKVVKVEEESFELSEDEDEKEKVVNVKDESFEVTENNVQYIDEEAEEIKKEIDSEEESKEKEGEDFLDAVDYSSLVGNQGD